MAPPTNGYRSSRDKRYTAYKKASNKARTASTYKKRTMATPVQVSLNRRGVISKETGFVDLGNTNYNGNTTGSIALVATVPQGTTVNSRVGKKILWKGIQIRGQVSGDSTTLITVCAAMLIYDKRPQGSLPAITDILNSATQNSFLNDANSARFTVLKRWDWSVVGNAAASNLADSSIYAVDDYVKLKGKKCIFKAAGTGAIGDIDEGAIYIVTVGNAAAGTSDAVISLGFRTRFWDY